MSVSNVERTRDSLTVDEPPATSFQHLVGKLLDQLTQPFLELSSTGCHIRQKVFFVKVTSHLGGKRNE